MKNYLSNQAAIVHGLAEDFSIDYTSNDADDSVDEDIFDVENKEQSKTENWLADFLDNLEVLLAEKRVTEAMDALDEGERIAREANGKQKFSATALQRLRDSIAELRQKLADQLEDTISQPSTCGVELRRAVLALKNLGDGPRSHSLLLNSHHQKLQRSMQSLRSSTTSFGGVFTTALSQLVFSAIAQASSDSLAVFGDEPAYSSELVTWAVKQTETFSFLLNRHVLAGSAASGNLRVASECIQICLAHCSLLEARGLALSPILLRLFKNTLEQALSANLKRIEQSSASLAAIDDWELRHPPAGLRASSSTSSLSTAITSQPKLSTSAHRFSSMVLELLEDVAPLECLQLEGPALEGAVEVFNFYVSLLINALPGSMEQEENEASSGKVVRIAETESQQIALLANASLLADELLPRAAVKLFSSAQSNRADATPKRGPPDRQSRAPDQREWKRRLQRSIDRLRDSFCRLHALELIFTDDGYTRLNAQIYLGLEPKADEDWYPSPIFQELFLKLTRIATIASDMFVGRERFATILLMRLTETVILWLSEDQTFWEEIEEGAKPLDEIGIQQFYLDMEFVLVFASQGRYLSRNLQQVIKNIIERAIEAVPNIDDPSSVLQPDEWCEEVAQFAITNLTEQTNMGAVDIVG